MKIRNLGYPRIGKKRELKKALECYWNKESSAMDLENAAKNICAERWRTQFELGVDSIPINDFSFYDHVLDMAFLFGMVPSRFQQIKEESWFDTYFAMARGIHGKTQNAHPLDMTKWFNTNYHYLVPEVDPNLSYTPRWEKFRFELELARTYPYKFHGVLVGPWTLLKLSRLNNINFSDALQRILPLYREVLREFKKRNIEWVQMDEPALCYDLLKEDLRSVRKIYEDLSSEGVKLCLATYFESPDPWLSEIGSFPVAGLHLDLVRGSASLSWLKTKTFSKDKQMSLGVVSGRNLWAANLSEIRKNLQVLLEYYSTDNIWLAPACSLMHIPIDKKSEKAWDEEFLGWVSFAEQRLEELSLLKKYFSGDKSIEAILNERERLARGHMGSPRIIRNEVKQAVERIDEGMKKRKQPFQKRIRLQRSALKLPALPTTTLGSFPQTDAIRKARMDFKRGALSADSYQDYLQGEIRRVVQFQEKIGLDVLVHGECERNDMVEYFAEGLEGFHFSSNGWVQSYGSRCVKPPIIFGDVKRKAPITVDWFKYAQSLTTKPMKAMLTGPVTILNWSFVREDQPRERTAYQIALALREEVRDLERAGAKIIQIDEAALREGLPLKRSHWNQYLKWAIDAFRLCSSIVNDEIQIQTHMCYSEFGDIIENLVRMDADVLLIEHARSGDGFVNNFKKVKYPNDIGPGIYDIHSQSVPSQEDCEKRIDSLLTGFAAERLWINPDCGLKTRNYEEIEPALVHMVDAAKKVRARLPRK